MGGPPCPVGSVQRGIYEVVNGPRDRGQSWALKLMFRVTISANRISQKPVRTLGSRNLGAASGPVAHVGLDR